MRCRACNKALGKAESVAKDRNGEFLDLCNGCKRHSGLYTDMEARKTDTEDYLNDYLGEYKVEYDYEGEQELLEELTGINKNKDILGDL